MVSMLMNIIKTNDSGRERNVQTTSQIEKQYRNNSQQYVRNKQTMLLLQKKEEEEEDRNNYINSHFAFEKQQCLLTFFTSDTLRLNSVEN